MMVLHRPQKIISSISVVISVCVFGVGQTKPAIQQHAKNSACSNIVALAGPLNLNCSHLDSNQRRQTSDIQRIVRAILTSQIDAHDVLLKIEAGVSDIRNSIPKNYGELVPANDPQSPGCNAPSDALKLYLGGNLIYQSSTSLEQREHPVLSLGGKQIISFRKSGSGIVVNAKVFGSDGRIIAELREGKFYLNENNYFRSESDPSDLTVYDEHDEIALKIRYMNPTSIRISGKFVADQESMDVYEDHIEVNTPQFKNLRIQSNCLGNTPLGPDLVFR